MAQEEFMPANSSVKDYQETQTMQSPTIPDRKCPICSKNIIGNLSFHMALHPVDKPYTCKFCVQVFRTNEEFLFHTKNDHNKDKKFTCDNCGQVFGTKWRLKRHQKMHSSERQYKCPYCDDKFHNYDVWRHHEIRHLGPNNFKCDLCEVGFYTEQSFMKHSSAKKCTDEIHCCDIIFKKRLDYVDHFLSKHHRIPLGNHTCQFCKRVFPYASSKNYHENKCSQNLEALPSNSSTLGGKYNSADVPKPNSLGFYVCNLCGMGCHTAAGLKVHHGKQHRTGMKKDADKYPCPFCTKRLSSLGALYLHKQVHLKPHSCTICPKKFAHKFLLRNHMFTHTSSKRPFQCGFCDKTFTTKSQLSDHENTHTGNRPYKCRFCENSFKKRTALLYHTLRHTGEKRYKCKMCGVAFTQSSTCRQHEKAHLRTKGKRKFQCKDCVLAFWSVTQLRSHQNGMHSEDAPQNMTIVNETVLKNPMSAQVKIVLKDGQEHWVSPTEITADEEGNMYYYYVAA